MHNQSKIKSITAASLMAAVVCVTTIIIIIPSPMNGYVNFGDCFVLLSAWILGVLYGGIASAVGSCLSDIILGYAFYAPATLIIKGLMAVTFCLIYKLLLRVIFRQELSRKSHCVCAAIAGTASEIIMIAGYFAYAILVMDGGAAAVATIPGNAMQGIVCLAAFLILSSAGFSSIKRYLKY